VKVRKIPQRMCVGCQQMKPKKELIRVVRTPEGSIEIDKTSKKAGRGAYICPSLDCLKKAIKGKRLDKALEQKIDEEIISTLEKDIVGNEN
jgi:uncharacterized protein